MIGACSRTAQSTRLAPLVLAISPALSTAAFSPEMTICPGALSLATTTMPASAASGNGGFGRFDVDADQGRHRAHAHRGCRLHGLPAQAHQPCRIGKAEGARRAERGIFAQRMTGHDAGMPAKVESRLRAWSTRIMAMEAAMIAGWAFSVRTRSDSGPSHISRDRRWESASSTSSKASRAGANASATALPMPTAWLPCPGKINALTSVLRCSPLKSRLRPAQDA